MTVAAIAALTTQDKESCQVGISTQLPPHLPASPRSNDNEQWVVFCLDAGRYALPLSAVERIVPAAYITPLALAPPVVLGAIDVEGSILPAFSLRHRLGLPERAITPAHQFLIARTAHRRMVLVIDAAQGVIQQPLASMIDAASIVSDLAHISGVVALEDGLVLIHDLEQFLSPQEVAALDQAMSQDGPRAE
jgi:purine-binding chemotaxis protein CheW